MIGVFGEIFGGPLDSKKQSTVKTPDSLWVTLMSFLIVGVKRVAIELIKMQSRSFKTGFGLLMYFTSHLEVLNSPGQIKGRSIAELTPKLTTCSAMMNGIKNFQTISWTMKPQSSLTTPLGALCQVGTKYGP